MKSCVEPAKKSFWICCKARGKATTCRTGSFSTEPFSGKPEKVENHPDEFVVPQKTLAKDHTVQNTYFLPFLSKELFGEIPSQPLFLHCPKETTAWTSPHCHPTEPWFFASAGNFSSFLAEPHSRSEFLTQRLANAKTGPRGRRRRPFTRLEKRPHKE